MFDSCKIPIVLAYMMSIYVIASIYYIIRSRRAGTPFYDSLTPAQHIIKEKSVKVRKGIFFEGIMVSVLLLMFLKPFKKCID
tara:strand:+ start:90 stop:335 length:246 start_codon:yes stop_codon:yes gene_type:complete